MSKTKSIKLASKVIKIRKYFDMKYQCINTIKTEGKVVIDEDTYVWVRWEDSSCPQMLLKKYFVGNVYA